MGAAGRTSHTQPDRHMPAKKQGTSSRRQPAPRASARRQVHVQQAHEGASPRRVIKAERHKAPLGQRAILAPKNRIVRAVYPRSSPEIPVMFPDK